MNKIDNKEKINVYSYLMMIGHICNDMAQGALPAIIPFIVAINGIDYTAASGLIFASYFLSSLIQPLLGIMSDKKPMPWVMAVGMFISGLGISFIGFSNNYWVIFLLIMFSGLGSAMFHPEAGRMSNCLAGNKKGRGMSIFAVGGNIGFVIGPIITTAVVSVWSLKGTVIILLPVIITTLIFAYNNKNFIKYSNTKARVQYTKTEEPNKKNDWKGFAKLSVWIFSRSIINSGIQLFIPLYFVNVLMQTKQIGSLMVTVIAISAVFATFIGGHLADKFGFKKIILISFLMLFPLLILFLMIKNMVFATIVLVLIAISLNLGYSPSIALGQKYLPNSIGLASGITLGLSVSVGGIVAPLLGIVGDKYNLSIVMYILIAISFIGALGAAWVSEPSK